MLHSAMICPLVFLFYKPVYITGVLRKTHRLYQKVKYLLFPYKGNATLKKKKKTFKHIKRKTKINIFVYLD